VNKFLTLNQLSKKQRRQYNEAIALAFPEILSASPTINQYWNILESYYPEYQYYLISTDEDLIGFVNTIPFQFKNDLQLLPNEGWDWMLETGISNYDHKESPNYLGGLQVIVRGKYQGLGYSKQIISHCKQMVKTSSFLKLVIPIRPTKKHLFPLMSMKEYINHKDGHKNEIFDPWIRTHINSGAEIINICQRSMTIGGGIDFWEGMLNKKITKSGSYILQGALTPVKIDLTNQTGEYVEPNIWIQYK